jgi:hypothetical protein
MTHAFIRCVIPLAVLASGCLPSATPASSSASPRVSAPPATPNTETPTLTWQQQREAIAATLVAGNTRTVRDSIQSPNGNWVAEVLAYDCAAVEVAGEDNALDILHVTNTRTAEARVVEQQVISCGGLGASGLSIRSWSRNSRYLYYTDGAFGMPEGCGWWVPPTKRLNASDWSIDDLGNGPWSADGEMLATWQASSLLISSTEEGDIARIQPIEPRMIAGQIAWSPAATALVYLQSELDCYPWRNTLLAYVDVTTQSSRLLFESEAPSFVWVQWNEPNTLILRDQDDNEWVYDLASDRFSKSE